MRRETYLLLLTLWPAAQPLRAEDLDLALKPQQVEAARVPPSQLLGEMLAPLGEALELAGRRLALQRGADDRLSIDLKGDGRFRPIKPGQELDILLDAAEGRERLTLRIQFVRAASGWGCRNLTHFTGKIGKQSFAIIDADGNGEYADVGRDGLQAQGWSFAVPLPGPDEDFCLGDAVVDRFQPDPSGRRVRLRCRPLQTSRPEYYALLQDANTHRRRVGVLPRPEIPELSGDLAQHCEYMRLNGGLTHVQEPHKPGYNKAGAAAGHRSYLHRSSQPERFLRSMIATVFHRFDIIRPDAAGFGLGRSGAYSGIDGRGRLVGLPGRLQPLCCPAPDEIDVGTCYRLEAPDAAEGQERAGYPITVYFFAGPRARLLEGRISVCAQNGAGPPLELIALDPQTEPGRSLSAEFNGIALVPRQPLRPNTRYEAFVKVELKGQTWEKRWRFQTGGEAARNNPRDGD